MAGSFGYETEHYSLSQAIGELLFENVEESDAEEVITVDAWPRIERREPSNIDSTMSVIE